MWRILAHLSEDPLLISTLHTAEDVFSSLAARYLGGVTVASLQVTYLCFRVENEQRLKDFTLK